jgi:hypothetical protein
MSWDVNGGYIGQSLSVRAQAERDNGGRPLSEWTKEDILEAIEEACGKEARLHATALSLSELRDKALNYAGWHHTSKYFNRTEFYEIADDLTPEEVLSWGHVKTIRKPAEKPVKHVALVSFVRWEGNYRRWRKPVTHKGIATWTTAHDKDSMAKVVFEGETEMKRTDSLTILKTLSRIPSKREKLYSVMAKKA